MGEPGTQELVKLEDLEATSGLTGRKHLLSLLVENKPGVLARIAAAALRLHRALAADRAVVAAVGLRVDRFEIFHKTADLAIVCGWRSVWRAAGGNHTEVQHDEECGESEHVYDLGITHTWRCRAAIVSLEFSCWYDGIGKHLAKFIDSVVRDGSRSNVEHIESPECLQMQQRFIGKSASVNYDLKEILRGQSVE
jgi:hypothetical protein